MLFRSEVQKRLTPSGLEIRYLGPDQFADYIRIEYEKWGEIVRRVGIKPE